MTDPIHSPYNFVPLEGTPIREGYPGLDRLARDSYSGVLTCDLEVITRLFTADHQTEQGVGPAGYQGKVFSFLRNHSGTPIIQAATLKGVIRSVFEAAFPSCLPLAAPSRISKKTTYRLTLPNDYNHESCKDLKRLCPACRLFGIAQGDDVHAQGRVGFADAVLTKKALHEERVELAELSSPKPHHYEFYSKTLREGGEIKGRKLYYHHDPDLQPAVKKLSERASVITEYAPPEAGFTFTVRFVNLSEVELGRLLACLILEADHGHKLGMAKPLGYGSCRIAIREEESFVERGGGRYKRWPLGRTPFDLSKLKIPKDWLTGTLEELLRLKPPGAESTGYLPYGTYKGKEIDSHGKYVSVRPQSPARPLPPRVEPKPPSKPTAGFTGALQISTPEKREEKHPKKVVLEVVSYENGVFTLRNPENEQEVVKYRGTGVPWQEGDRPKVRVVKRGKDGRILEIQA